MDATSLITPSDTKKSVNRTHTFMIINVVIIVLSLGATIGWLLYANSKKKYPFEKYTRDTAPPGLTKMSTLNLPNQGTASTVANTDNTAPTGGAAHANNS